jgi:sugar O-acyltransferase (sialic acid O-acetyltransferase NeuD family)
MPERPANQRILVMGTTAYSEVFVDMFAAVPNTEFSGFVENIDQDRCGTTLADRPVFWHESIADKCRSHHLICSIASTKRDAWIEAMLARGFDFSTLVHPSCTVSARTVLGRGVSVDAGCVIAGFSRIGDFVRIGRCVSFGHHSEVGAYATIHPGAVVSGNTHIGPRTIIGSGATLIDGISVGAGAVIAAGSVVIRDVPPRALVAGNPAVVKRENDGPR